MKRLAIKNIYIEITENIINHIRNLIVDEKKICEDINLRLFFKSFKNKHELTGTVKKRLSTYTIAVYEKINQYLLNKFEPKKNTVYILNQFNTKFDAADYDRIDNIFGSYKEFINIIWSDKIINNFINNHYFFIQNYKDLLHILNTKSLRNILFDEINIKLNNQIMDIIATDVYDNNINISKSINNIKNNLYNMIFNILKDMFIDKKSFKIEFIDNNKRGIRLNIALADIEKFTRAIIAHKEFIKLINKQINTNNEQFQKDLEKRKIDKIGITDMKSGEIREIDGYYFWWNNSHDTSYKCIVYINGNIAINIYQYYWYKYFNIISIINVYFI